MPYFWFNLSHESIRIINLLDSLKLSLGKVAHNYSHPIKMLLYRKLLKVIDKTN